MGTCNCPAAARLRRCIFNLVVIFLYVSSYASAGAYVFWDRPPLAGRGTSASVHLRFSAIFLLASSYALGGAYVFGIGLHRLAAARLRRCILDLVRYSST